MNDDDDDDVHNHHDDDEDSDDDINSNDTENNMNDDADDSFDNTIIHNSSESRGIPFCNPSKNVGVSWLLQRKQKIINLILHLIFIPLSFTHNSFFGSCSLSDRIEAQGSSAPNTPTDVKPERHKIYRWVWLSSPVHVWNSPMEYALSSKINVLPLGHQYSAGTSFSARQSITDKPMEVYYLDERIIITLDVAGFLHPAIF